MENNDKNSINNDWLEWFIGFNDAEGNFQVYPKKNVLKDGSISSYRVGYSYHLSLHSRDILLIKDIKKILNNIGTIYVYKTKSDSRLAVNDKESLLYLIKNIFDVYPLLTNNQLTRYNLLKYGLINNIKKFNTLEEYDKYKTEKLLFNLPQHNLIELYKCNKLKIDNWIVGFINGEGSFYINKDKNKFSFYIEHTDKHVLGLIKYRFDFSPNVLKRSIRYRDLNKIRKICYQLSISSKKDIYKLINFLDNNNISLQGYKFEQYNKWKQELNY